MGSPAVFIELKKQASFFLKEKIKTARLALTDVTPAQLLVEEVTDGNPGVLDSRILKLISRAAFEIDDYSRIVDILHQRFASLDKKNWRASYHSLVVLEHLLTHGPQSVAMEFEADIDLIRESASFQDIDEQAGLILGVNMRNKAERIVKLLENDTLLKEERNKGRTVTRALEEFGCFNINPICNSHVIPQESSKKDI